MFRIKATQYYTTKSTCIAGSAAVFLALSTAVLGAATQQPATPPLTQSPAVSQASSRGTAASKAHEDAVRFVELLGVRQQIEQNADKSVENGVDSMLRQFPNTDPRFVAEWKKRMVAELNPNDYVNVVVEVYEKHFTAAELEELTAAVRARRESKTPALSPQLAEKIKASSVDVQIEIMAGCAKVGARAGEKIAQDIGKEHPDWVKSGNSTVPAAR